MCSAVWKNRLHPCIQCRHAFSDQILVFCCMPSVQRTNPTRQTRRHCHFIQLWDLSIKRTYALIALCPNPRVFFFLFSLSWIHEFIWAAKSHLSLFSSRWKSCCRFSTFHVAVVFVYWSSLHMFATSFLSAHNMLFLFHLSNSPRK